MRRATSPFGAILSLVGVVGAIFYLVDRPELFVMAYLTILILYKARWLLIAILSYRVPDEEASLENGIPASMLIIAEVMHISLMISHQLFLVVCWVLILVGAWRDSPRIISNNC